MQCLQIQIKKFCVIFFYVGNMRDGGVAQVAYSES
jgi:hypothetical protein